MKKRIVTIALVVALLATCFAGTYAYLTDNASKTNTFTVGSVDIELLESQLHRQNDQATDEQIIADAANYQNYLATAGQNMVPGRWVKKAPYVQNTGKNPAYVRIRVIFTKKTVESLYFMEYTTALNDKEKGIVRTINLLDANREVLGTVNEYAEINTSGIDNWAYLEYVYNYIAPLAPNAVTYYAPFWQIALKYDLNNSELTAMADADKTIEVYADAIQSEGFDNYTEAFAAFNAQQ